MLSRLDLDGLGSPAMIAKRIHDLELDMPLAFSVEELCSKLDIVSIDKIETSGFEAALVMDINKAAGGILLAAGRARQRQRYSIAHELGHFLIPTHMPRAGECFECSLADLHRLDAREKNRRYRIEAEANRFAAALLMPVTRVRANLAFHTPDLGEIVRLARDFDVSKEAMARTYIDAHREALAVLVLQHGKILRIYRDQDQFPWIALRAGQSVPAGSLASGHALRASELSDAEECDPDVWFEDRDSKRIELLTEQLLGQVDGFSMLLLHAQMIDESD